MSKTYDRRYFLAPFTLVFTVFLGFLATENYRWLVIFASPAAIAFVSLLGFLPRREERVPEEYRMSSLDSVMKPALTAILVAAFACVAVAFASVRESRTSMKSLAEMEIAKAAAAYAAAQDSSGNANEDDALASSVDEILDSLDAGIRRTTAKFHRPESAGKRDLLTKELQVLAERRFKFEQAKREQQVVELQEQVQVVEDAIARRAQSRDAVIAEEVARLIGGTVQDTGKKPPS